MRRSWLLVRPSLAAAAAVTLALVPGAPASAALCDFQQAAGNWNVAGNWSCNLIPSGPANDSATITGGRTVTVNDSRSIDALTNAGSINIDAFLLELQGGSTTNTGTINVGSATNAALNVNAGHNINNAGGTINITSGSALNQSGSSISGGSINGAGSVVASNSASNFLSALTLGANLDMASNAASRERITGGLTLNGTATINQSGILSFEGTQTIDGTGSIVLGMTGASNRIDLDGNGSTTFGSDIKVRGENGSIGRQLNIGGTQTLINGGTISADVAGGQIEILESAVTNNGTLEARNGGTLVLSSNVTGNIGGQIFAGTGSTVLQNGSTLSGAINSSGTGLLRATSSNANFLTGATVAGNLDLTLVNARERITAGGLVLNGTIDINSNGILSFEGDGGLSGTGTIVLGATGAGNRIDFDGNGTTTFGINSVVRGENGRIGQQINIGGTQTLVNNGTIAADVDGGTIEILETAVTNNGRLEAKNGGTLVLSSNVAGGATGQIAVAADSLVLQNGVRLSGNIVSSGGGLFRATSSNANFLDATTLTGNLDLTLANARERVTAGGLVLNGTIDINSNGILSFEGDGGLSGNGTIVLGATGAGNRIDFDGNGTTTFGINSVVRGENGRIGQQINIGGTQTLVNNGTIAADVDGGTIEILDTAVTNNGRLEAKNGGTLILSSNVMGAALGLIAVDADSLVLQNGVRLSGNIVSSGGGLFRATSSNLNFLDATTLTGNLDLTLANARERVTAGGLVLNGTIDINSNGILSFEGDGGLSGNGTIVLGATGAGNRIDLDGNGTTTFDANAIIRGENGTIGMQLNIGGTQTLVNNGLISADVAGGTIRIEDSAITNNGRVEARNGGTLVLSSDFTGGSGGTIFAGAGSTVLQEGVSVSGIINNTGSGLLRATSSGANFLSGVTLNGVLDLAAGNARERVAAGGMTLNGRIDINNNGILSFEGDGTISGSGSILFGDTGAGNRVDLDGNGTTTVGSGITIHGENGTIGMQLNIGGTQTLVNNGLISADVAGGRILVTDSAVSNQNRMEARNGGTLELRSAVTNSNGGFVLADAGIVEQNGIRITGGELRTANDGRIVANTSNANFLDAVSVEGVLDMASLVNSRERVNNGLNVDGRIDIDNGGVVSFEGTQTVDGSGSIVFGATGANQIVLDGNGVTTIGAGLTVRGHSGTIGQQLNIGGTQSLINNGTVSADVSGGNVNFRESAVTNNGLFEAKNGGNLSLFIGVNGTGTLKVDASSALTLSNVANSQGRLQIGAVGSTLNIGTQNLTLSNDYTNEQAGTGNVFNRRAGVVGTGLIISGGDATQAITGDNVVNGNTANATLTLGNVRVGATTFNYQVANVGTTGPALRGAIQTNVNGANISDARLSGSGVTSNNYNTGAPGNDSGDLAVTFTAANAGALAPLSGQVLNLRSNFDDIADQKLNIVLAGGAAAFNAAIGSTTTPVQLANQRIGGSNSAVLAVRNNAAAGAFSEDLNASIGASSGDASATGSVSGRRAGLPASGTGSIVASVDTTTAGAMSGIITLDYVTTGTVNGVSNGLGMASVGSQDITVNGNVFKAATGAIQTAALNFGTLQVGQSVMQDLVIRNTATGAAGFVEDLNASFGAAGNAQISGSGSLLGILAGSNSDAGNGLMRVTVNGTTAGLLNSSIAVNYATAGAVNGVSNGLGTAPAGSEAYGVNGEITAVAVVINQANPLINTPSINLGAVRVGAVSPTAFVSLTNVTTLPPQAALNASIAGNGAPVLASGSVNLLAPGGTDASSLSVGLATDVAGNYTGANAGMATISLVSDASNVGNCEPNCQLNLTSQTVSVSGKVYTAAVGALNTTTVDFGVVRVGDVVAGRTVEVANAAAITALNDTLSASLAGIDGPFSGNGALAGVAAQSSANFLIGVSTANAGVYNDNGTVAFASHNADMSDVSAGFDANVAVKATVNNYANADFDLLAGLGVLTQSGEDYFLDLGTIIQGRNIGSALAVDNDVMGPADALSGMFDLGGADDFTYLGWDAFSGLEAGLRTDRLNIAFLASTVGMFDDVVLFSGRGTNMSDAVGVQQMRRLFISARVIADNNNVPAPPAYLLLLLAGVGLLLLQRRCAVARG